MHTTAPARGAHRATSTAARRRAAAQELLHAHYTIADTVRRVTGPRVTAVALALVAALASAAYGGPA